MKKTYAALILGIFSILIVALIHFQDDLLSRRVTETRSNPGAPPSPVFPFSSPQAQAIHQQIMFAQKMQAANSHLAKNIQRQGDENNKLSSAKTDSQNDFWAPHSVKNIGSVSK